MNEPGPAKTGAPLPEILSSEITALRRQAEIDIEVMMREHRYELDQLLQRQKSVLKALTTGAFVLLAAGAALFFWLRGVDREGIEESSREISRELDLLKRRNEEAQALVESFRDIERVWKRRLLDASGARPVEDLPPVPGTDAPPAEPEQPPAEPSGGHP